MTTCQNESMCGKGLIAVNFMLCYGTCRRLEATLTDSNDTDEYGRNDGSRKRLEIQLPTE